MGNRKVNKYSYAFKLQCIEAVLKKKQSIIKVSRDFGIRPSNLRLWLGFYEKYGRSSLCGRVNQRYNPASRLIVLQAIEREKISLREACIRYNIPSMSTIILWQRAYRSKGYAGLINKPQGRPPNMKSPIKRRAKKPSKPLTREEELLKENEYLRAENALLKKLQALVQADKKQKP